MLLLRLPMGRPQVPPLTSNVLPRRTLAAWPVCGATRDGGSHGPSSTAEAAVRLQQVLAEYRRQQGASADPRIVEASVRLQQVLRAAAEVPGGIIISGSHQSDDILSSPHAQASAPAAAQAGLVPDSQPGGGADGLLQPRQGHPQAAVAPSATAAAGVAVEQCTSPGSSNSAAHRSPWGQAHSEQVWGRAAAAAHRPQHHALGPLGPAAAAAGTALPRDAAPAGCSAACAGSAIAHSSSSTTTTGGSPPSASQLLRLAPSTAVGNVARCAARLAGVPPGAADAILPPARESPLPVWQPLAAPSAAPAAAVGLAAVPAAVSSLAVVHPHAAQASIWPQPQLQVSPGGQPQYDVADELRPAVQEEDLVDMLRWALGEGVPYDATAAEVPNEPHGTAAFASSSQELAQSMAAGPEPLLGDVRVAQFDDAVWTLPLPPPPPPPSPVAALEHSLAEAGAAVAQSAAGLAEGYHAAVSALDDIYAAVLTSSGVGGFMTGLRQLADDISESFAATWPSVPPLVRIVTVVASVLGAVVLIKQTREQPDAVEEGKELAAGATAPATAHAAVPQVVNPTAVIPPPAASPGAGPYASTAATSNMGSSTPRSSQRSIPMRLLPQEPLSAGASMAAATATAPPTARGSSVAPGSHVGTSNSNSNSNGTSNGNGNGNGKAHSASRPAALQQWGRPNGAALNGRGNGVPRVSMQSAQGSTAVEGGALCTPAGGAAPRISRPGQGFMPTAEHDDPKLREVTRAATLRRGEQERLRLCEQVKEQLRWATVGLGPIMSVVPVGEPLRQEVDALIQQLESLSVNDKPLNMRVDVQRRPTVDPLAPPAPEVDPQLLGDWRLEYASNAGTATGNLVDPDASINLFAQLMQLADRLPGFGMDYVRQRLLLDPARPDVIITENIVTFRFGLLGQWRVTAAGAWQDAGGGMCAKAWFETFSVQPVEFLGLQSHSLPPITVPIPEPMRWSSEWCTTFLDGSTRVGRDGQGHVFLFSKEGAAAAATAARRASAEYGNVSAAAPPPLYGTVVAPVDGAGVPSWQPISV